MIRRFVQGDGRFAVAEDVLRQRPPLVEQGRRSRRRPWCIDMDGLDVGGPEGLGELEQLSLVNPGDSPGRCCACWSRGRPTGHAGPGKRVVSPCRHGWSRRVRSAGAQLTGGVVDEHDQGAVRTATLEPVMG